MMATLESPPPRRRPKGILALLSRTDKEEAHAPEHLEIHPYDKTALLQTDKLLRRHRTHKKHPSSSPYDALSSLTASPSSTSMATQQHSLEDIMENTDLILLFFAEARGCAHSIRVRSIVSHFCSVSSSFTRSDVQTDRDDNAHETSSSKSTTTPSCRCIVILNGPPEESVDWKRTFVNGTGFYVWPPVSSSATTSTSTTSYLFGDNMKDNVDSESLLSRTPPVSAPDHRRSALIQYVTTIHVMDFL